MEQEVAGCICNILFYYVSIKSLFSMEKLVIEMSNPLKRISVTDEDYFYLMELFGKHRTKSIKTAIEKEMSMHERK